MPVTVVDVREYTDEEDGHLDIDRVLERVDELKEARDEAEGYGDDFSGDAAQELRVLLAFVGDLRRDFDDRLHLLTLVPDDEFERFVRWEAEENYGIGPENVGDYVNWTEYAEDRRGWWSSVMLDGRTILVRDDSRG